MACFMAIVSRCSKLSRRLHLILDILRYKLCTKRETVSKTPFQPMIIASLNYNVVLYQSGYSRFWSYVYKAASTVLLEIWICVCQPTTSPASLLTTNRSHFTAYCVYVIFIVSVFVFMCCVFLLRTDLVPPLRRIFLELEGWFSDLESWRLWRHWTSGGNATIPLDAWRVFFSMGELNGCIAIWQIDTFFEMIGLQLGMQSYRHAFLLVCTIPEWWRHQMETISALLALCAGNSPVTDELLSQRPVTRSFDVSFYMRLNKRLSKYSRCRWCVTPLRPFWRECNGLWSTWEVKFNDYGLLLFLRSGILH